MMIFDMQNWSIQSLINNCESLKAYCVCNSYLVEALSGILKPRHYQTAMGQTFSAVHVDYKDVEF